MDLQARPAFAIAILTQKSAKALKLAQISHTLLL